MRNEPCGEPALSESRVLTWVLILCEYIRRVQGSGLCRCLVGYLSRGGRGGSLCCVVVVA